MYYSNENFENFYVRYKAEGLPRKISIQEFCLRNKMSWNLFNKWYRDTRHRIKEVAVTGCPVEQPEEAEPAAEQSTEVSAALPQQCAEESASTKSAALWETPTAPSGRCSDMTEVEKEKLIDYLFKQVEGLQFRLAGVQEELRLQREQSAGQHADLTSQLERMEERAVAAEKRAEVADKRVAELTTALTAMMDGRS